MRGYARITADYGLPG